MSLNSDFKDACTYFEDDSKIHVPEHNIHTMYQFDGPCIFSLRSRSVSSNLFRIVGPNYQDSYEMYPVQAQKSPV